MTSRKDDDAQFIGLAESVHPVRRVEFAFKLLDRAEEFVQCDEQKRGKDNDEE